MARSCWSKVPILNVIHAWMFDETPSLEQVFNILATFALVNGLTLTMAGAEMNVLDAEQAGNLRAQVEGWINGGDQFDLIVEKGINPYERFVWYSLISFGSIMAAIFQVLLMYLFIGSISFEDDCGRHSNKAMTVWWKWIRIVITTCFFFTALGIAMLVIATSMAWAMQHGHTAEELQRYLTWTDISSYTFLVALGVVLPLVLLSGGLISKTYTHEKMEQLDRASESVSHFVPMVGQAAGCSQQHVDLAVRRLSEENGLNKLSDLLGLDEDDWCRLNIPWKLEKSIKDELAVEDPAQQINSTTARQSPAARALLAES